MPTPTTTRRWVSDLSSGYRALELQPSAPLPTLLPHQVLIRIKAVSLNYRDLDAMTGYYNTFRTHSKTPLPLVPCSDGAGIIVAVGSAVDLAETGVAVGDEVLCLYNTEHMAGPVTAYHMQTGSGLPLEGCLTEYKILPHYATVRKPAYLGWEQAVTLVGGGSTCWTAFFCGMRPLRPGMTVLILGTGGVSIVALQIAKAMHVTTIVTSSSDEKLKTCATLGADYCINYTHSPNWSEEVLRITNGTGVDMVMETAGQKTIIQSLKSLKWGGLINDIGYVSGKGSDAELLGVSLILIRKHAMMQGVIVGGKDVLQEVANFYEKARIVPFVDRVFPFDQAKEAFAYLESQKHMGKVIINLE
ncbi:putative alcohol dehydrogenase [Lophium mytilinum]|uniref:Putative alcohol dehydrogenase n=1 Tax=Lophium mytilinum TaxID=390894 RepID=A0A6A6QNL7_9PEZI|nr:putative alcohol dehydrogenase [Lophium mytilinum]